MDEESLFAAALEKSDPAERRAFLDEACGPDAGLRRRLERLLAAAEHTAGILSRGAVTVLDSSGSASLAAGELLAGRFRLRERLGAGGMGEVWVADQLEPVQRRVALKVIRPGLDSATLIARFDQERQALARMDHPGIAKVLDAGTTEAGRPYFVMELIQGVPITEYCDAAKLSLRQRLELFVPVCQAVQHAHQKGIIHRDLKPSNVLVAVYDDKPAVKVIDFGVAKATGQPLTEETLHTGFGTVVGTVEYMSPEQAGLNQLDVDTRSDIYSLGVLLYELLTGSPPFTRQVSGQGGMLEMLRVIREQEPTRPSAKLSTAEALPTLAANRGTEPAKLTRLVRGELDWIVMKALEKDRGRRYETASGFAADVQRYLADEPVLACPPSASYRLGKFARRNKGSLAVAALVLFFLVLLGSGIGWAMRDRAARQGRTGAQADLILAEVEQREKEQKWPEALATARRAEAAVAGGEADAATTRRVRERLRDLEFIDRLEQIRMQRATRLEGTAGFFAEADQDYARAFSDYGVDVEGLAVEASIERLKARPELALPLAAALDDWVRVRQQIAATDAASWKPLVAVARGIDAEPLRDRLRSTWGQPAAETRDELRRLAASIDVRAHHPATLCSLVLTLHQVNLWDSALQILRDARFVYPGDFWITLWLGIELAGQKDLEGGERFLTAAVSIRPNSAGAHRDLAILLERRKKPVEAAAAYRVAIALDPSFPHDTWLRQRLCKILKDHKKLDEAVACLKEAIERDPNAVWAHHELARTLRMQKKLEEASACFRRVIELDPTHAAARQILGITLREQKKLDEAVACLKEAVERDPNAFWAHHDLAATLSEQKRPDEAIAEFRQAITLERKMAPAPPQPTPSQCGLAELLNDRAWRLVTGDPRFRDPGRALDLAQEVAALVPPDNAAFRRTLGAAHYRAANWEAAARALEESRKLNPDYRNDSGILFFLSMAHARLHENEQARTCYDQAARWRMGIGMAEEELRRLCAEAAALLGLEVPPTLQEPPVLTPGPTLVKPARGAILDNGTLDQSKVVVWQFDWSEVAGATQYHLRVTGRTGMWPQINDSALTSPSFRLEGRMYTLEEFRLGWRWKVRALVQGVWTDWSEERTFDVAPLDDSEAPAPRN